MSKAQSEMNQRLLRVFSSSLEKTSKESNWIWTFSVVTSSFLSKRFLLFESNSYYLRGRFFQQKTVRLNYQTLGKKADDVRCPKVLPHSSRSLRSQTREEPLSTRDHQCMAKNKPGKRKGWHVNLGCWFGSFDVYFTHVLCLTANST